MVVYSHPAQTHLQNSRRKQDAEEETTLQVVLCWYQSGVGGEVEPGNLLFVWTLTSVGFWTRVGSDLSSVEWVSGY